jgi:glycopeptide antibiotics resistance protein
MRNVPWFLPTLGLIMLGAVALARPAARHLRTTSALAWSLIVAFGAVAAVTLTPGAGALEFGAIGPSTCDTSRIGLAPIADIVRMTDPGLNILLFIPLGAALGLLPRSRTRVLLIVVAIALPFVIEAIQLLASALDRSCETGDIVDNLTGLAIGLVAGVIIGPVQSRGDRD